MIPDIIYYESAALGYELGKQLQNKFENFPWVPIESHNNIAELQKQENHEFPRMKRHLIVGVRKSLRYTPNTKVSDFLVPYTSSGCAAMCLYCYLVCNYNKCSYLRLFVNREQMLEKLKKTATGSDKDLVFEIGSNSDLVLENTVTGNLEWTITRFAREERGFLTFPTKFHMVEPLLSLDHRGRVIARVSMNPEEIIRGIEIGTSPLQKRIDALNALCDAGYRVGLLIAPIVLLENWRILYEGLIDTLAQMLSAKAKQKIAIEIIFMTYSYVHRAINRDAFPGAADLYDPSSMTARGRGRYRYRDKARDEAEQFLREQLSIKLPEVPILYIV